MLVAICIVQIIGCSHACNSISLGIGLLSGLYMEPAASSDDESNLRFHSRAEPGVNSGA